MSRIHREHAISIADEAGTRIIEKYKQGQEEHGGNLWDRDVLADALNESTDLMTYLITLRDQIYDAAEALNVIVNDVEGSIGNDILDILEGPPFFYGDGAIEEEEEMIDDPWGDLIGENPMTETEFNDENDATYRPTELDQDFWSGFDNGEFEQEEDPYDWGY